MRELWERFILIRCPKEGVGARTMKLYEEAWDRWSSYLPERVEDLNRDAVEMFHAKFKRDHPNVSQISINTYMRPLNTFLNWLREKNYVTERCSLEPGKESRPERRVFTQDEVDRILTAEPQGVNEARVQVLAGLLLTTGIRIDEALALRVEDVNFTLRLIKIKHGKGDKARTVGIAGEVRTLLYAKTSGLPPDAYLFSTRAGTPLTQRNSLRDFVHLANRLGLKGKKLSWHTFRHTYGTNYIRRGGSVEDLRILMGHSSIQTTMLYVKAAKSEELARTNERFIMWAKRKVG